jgi:hypothetical protein
LSVTDWIAQPKKAGVPTRRDDRGACWVVVFRDPDNVQFEFIGMG